MSRGDFKRKAAQWLAALIRLPGWLPPTVRRMLARAFGHVFARLPRRENTVARLQLDLFVPEHGGARLLPEVYCGFAQTALESLNLAPLLSEPDRYIRCAQPDLLGELIASERGIIALTAHTGNWDLTAAYMVRKGVKLATIGREARNPVLQRLLSGIRDEYGVITLWRHDSSVTKDLIKHLKQGHTVAALIDQDTRVSSVFAPFFGRPVKTPIAAVGLGKKYNAHIVSAFVFRTAPYSYTIYLHEFDPALTADEIVSQYNRQLEEWLQRFPTQWVWFHKRWRTIPDRETLGSEDYIEFLQNEISAAH